MEVREWARVDSQGEIEPDSLEGCRCSASFHHLAAVAVADDVVAVVAVGQSVRVAVSAAVVGRPAVGRPADAAAS